MTKREKKINEKYSRVTSNFYQLYEEGINVLVENYNPKTAGAYGRIENMDVTYSLAKKLYRANFGNWDDTYLTTGEIVGDMNVSAYTPVFSFVRKSDIKEIWRKRYVVLHKGGVYDILTGFWHKKKDFFKDRETYNRNVKYNKAIVNTHQKFIKFAKDYISNTLESKIDKYAEMEDINIHYSFSDIVLAKLAIELNDNIEASESDLLIGLVNVLSRSSLTDTFGMNSVEVVDDSYEYRLINALSEIEESINPRYNYIDYIDDEEDMDDEMEEDY